MAQDKKLLELGRKLQDFYDTGYVTKKQAFGFSFLKGMATGAGAFIGGTLVIGIVLWLLSLFDQVPFVGQIFEAIRHSLQSQK